MSWNDERVELLKKLWAEGLSASQIAGRIGGVTRNAVIGKVHRLGLSGRAPTSRSTTNRPRQRISTARRVARPRFVVPAGNQALRALYQPDAEPLVPSYEEIDVPLAERKSILELTESDCHWPIGDPQLAEFHFCNRKKVPGLPYCEDHARRAFQPPQPRRRDRTTREPAIIALAQQPVATSGQPAQAPTPQPVPSAGDSKEPVEV